MTQYLRKYIQNVKTISWSLIKNQSALVQAFDNEKISNYGKTLQGLPLGISHKMRLADDDLEVAVMTC